MVELRTHGDRSIFSFVVWLQINSLLRCLLVLVSINGPGSWIQLPPPLQHVRPCCYTTGITADYHRVEKRLSWRSEMHLCSNVVEGRRRGLPRRPALWLAGCRARIPVAEVCAALFLVCTRTELISCKNRDENVDEFQSSDMDEYEQVRIYLDYL